MAFAFRSFIVLASLFASLIAQAQEKGSSWLSGPWGVEAGVLALSQGSTGDTVTVLPLANKTLWTVGAFSLVGQLGGTAYRDATLDQTFSIAVVRLNPQYRFEGSRLFAEAHVGLQSWEGRGAKLELGLRANYALVNVSFADDVFVAGGMIQHENPTNFANVGLRSWF